MISVLIPALGNQFGRFEWGTAVRHILDMDLHVDYEIIVCSPRKWPLSHPKIKVISDPEGNEGSIKPVNECLRVSQGEYFISMPSDHLIHPNSFNIQSFIESEAFANRKYKITSTGLVSQPKPGTNLSILGNKHIDQWLARTTEIDNLTRAHVPILTFPAGARSTVEDLLDGVIFNETFKHVAGDNFLSAYVASKENPQQLPLFMPETPCGRDNASAAQNQLRERDMHAYFELMRYYLHHPDMTYNHILEIDEDFE